jgi:hypothetical protein
MSQPSRPRKQRTSFSDRVAQGSYLPRAPTDPYVPALEHTVPQIMVTTCLDGQYAGWEAGDAVA